MSSISISARKAAFSTFNLWRLKHQREFWKTARQFYFLPESQIGRYEYDMKENEHWDIFTRENILRTRHVSRLKAKYEKIKLKTAE